MRAILAVLDRVWEVEGGSSEEGVARRRSWWRNDGRIFISEATGWVSDESEDELRCGNLPP